MNFQFNVSIPYLQMKSCKIRDSKFGLALVIETSIQSGEYVLGFRIDPADKLEQVTKEIHSLCRTYLMRPVFGVEFVKEKNSGAAYSSSSLPQEPLEEDVEIDTQSTRPDAISAYCADGGGGGKDRGPVYSEDLGVAIEKLKEGFTLRDLWEINVE